MIMADKNIQMTQRNSANTDWDNLFPMSKAENIQLSDTSGLFTSTDVKGALLELGQALHGSRTSLIDSVNGIINS